jgi:dynamin 1-like protein
VIHSKVLALTLVDLPGMAKVAVGDQPEDIEDQIREMSLQYISNPNAIILAVTSANTDLANSDALKLAQAVDPYGNRTVGVLTKLDLMDPGTDACDMLNNKVIPLRRGYIGVVNRGQIDVNSDLSIRDGLRKEETFFRNHPTYSRNRNVMAKCGTRHLSKALNNMLMHHIRDCLPELKNRITMMMTDVQAELDALGTPTESSARSTVGGVLLGMLSKFAAHFGSIIEGKGGQTNTNATTATKNAAVNELFGGARISYIFTDIFASSLLGVGAFDGLSDEEIRYAVCSFSVADGSTLRVRSYVLHTELRFVMRMVLDRHSSFPRYHSTSS